MDDIIGKNKEFEIVVTKHDPFYKDLISVIEIVKKFIIDNGLIIYGGSAIDYALKLHGDRIYPDDLLPDLDFYSYDNVEHSYQLADILYQHGYKESRSINAQHMETMRVDVGENHFVADITYRPREAFDSLPTLIFNGMKIIHPDFQRIDLHSSLSFPYDNSPREVIFDRWTKDIKRFNLLEKYYKLKINGDIFPPTIIKAGKDIRKCVLNGYIAYAFMYYYYAKSMEKCKVKVDASIISGELKIEGESVSFESLGKIEICHYDVEKCLLELNLKNSTTFETYIHIIPERIECDDYVIYSTRNKLLSVNSIMINDKTYRIVNIQYLLKHFMAMYFLDKSSPKIRNAHLARYLSLLKIIDSYQKLPEAFMESELETSPLLLSANAYGNENINLAKEVGLARLYHEIYGSPLPILPVNYYPDRNISRGKPHPIFDYSSSKFFREMGKIIEKNIDT